MDKKQILEDQCRAASETLFKKRRELQKLQKDYEDDARRLMEIKKKQMQMNDEGNQINDIRNQLDDEIAG